MQPEESTGSGTAGVPDASGPRTAAALLLCAAVLSAGCGFGGPEQGRVDVPLAVSTTSNQQLVRTSRRGAGPARLSGDEVPPRLSGPSRSVTVAGADGDTLVIDFVAFLVDRGRLKPRAVDDCGGDSTCVEIQTRPTAFTIPLDGTTEPQLQTRVGLGLYDEITFQLVAATSSDGALLDTLPEFEGNSVLVKGSFNGEPFTAARDIVGTVSFSISPGLDVTEATTATNVTLSSTVATWYQLSDGSVLDPRQESGRLTKQLIEASTTAFPDRDGDGEPDSTGPGSL